MVGVLALQGGFAAHKRMLRSLGAEVREVRVPADLDGLDGLVLPGGESTTMTLGIEREGLADPLRELAARGTPILGTCAGMIVLARRVEDGEPLFELIDITVRRNAYGRQVDSFEADLDVDGIDHGVRGVFIRAPRVEDLGPDVRVLASHEGHPVVLEQGNLLVASGPFAEVLRVPKAQLSDASPGAAEPFVTGVPGANCVLFDAAGNLFISGGASGTIFRVGPSGGAAEVFAQLPAPLHKALALSNNAPLIEMLLGQALVATDNKAYTDEAISILRAAVTRETEAPLGYSQLAMAYGRKGDYAEADLASAQAAYLRGDNKTARELAARAKTRFAVGTPGWVRADDIVTAKPLPGSKNN